MLTADDIRPNHYGQRYEYHCGGLWVVFDHIHPSSRGLDAWVEVRWTDKVPAPAMLHIGRMDLMGSRTTSAIVRSIEGGLNGVKGAWQDIVNTVLYDTIADHLAGPEPEYLTGVRGEGFRWLLAPLVGASGATSLIAPGGSGKSFIALAAALSVGLGRSKFLQMKPRVVGPVAYLDWEAQREDHDERAAALCAAHRIDPPTDQLLYFSMAAPLWRVADAIEKRVQREGVVMVVVDSVMLARGGDAFGPEETVRLYAALRQIGVPALLIDHKSREAIKKGTAGAYGSVVNDNTARLQWEITAVDQPGPDRSLLRLEVSKRNNVGRVPPLGLEMTFVNSDDRLETIGLRQIDPATVRSLSYSQASISDLVVHEIRLAGDEGILVSEIADALGKQPNQIRNVIVTLSREGRVMERKVGKAKRWYWAGADEQQGFQAPDEMPM